MFARKSAPLVVPSTTLEIIAIATSSVSGNGLTVHPVTLPSGRQVGDLLIVTFATDATPSISGHGMTVRRQYADAGGSLWLLTKTLVAGDSVTITTSATECSACVAIAARFSESPSFLHSVGGDSSSFLRPDIGSVAPCLWVGVAFSDGQNSRTLDAGSRYTDSRNVNVWGNSSYHSVSNLTVCGVTDDLQQGPAATYSGYTSVGLLTAGFYI